MLRQQREKQQKMNLVIMEQMVPEDHFLRKVDRAVDFSFIYELCAPLYCADNGRPAIDPEILLSNDHGSEFQKTKPGVRHGTDVGQDTSER